jgi:hypothetical protein
MEEAMTDPNRKFHELAGMCWHGLVWTDHRGTICSKCDESTYLGDHPDYAADPRLVLEVIARLPYPRLREFLSWLGRNGTSVPAEYFVTEDGSLEQTGKLLTKAIEWMEACR